MVQNIFNTFIFFFLFPCRSGKRWDQKLVKPDLNYSEIFSEDVGSDEGSLIYIYDI